MKTTLGLPGVEPDEEETPLSRRELATFLRTVSTMVDSGAPIDRSLTAAARVHGGAIAGFAHRVVAAVSSGSSLASALEGSEAGRNTVLQGLVAAGEQAGRLPIALEQAAAYVEAEVALRSRVRQALAYPAVLCLTGGLSLLFILAFVVPRFARLLDDPGQLPWATRLLLATSAHLRDVGAIAAIVLGALVAVLIGWLPSPSGRVWLDRALHPLPKVGPLRWAIASERFSRALGEMVRAGVPLLTALDRASDAAANQVVAERGWSARERVRAGESLAGALGAERVVPEIAVQLVGLGEASGRLTAMIERAADQLRRNVEDELRGAVATIEPIVVVAFGGIIALVAGSLLQAVYSLRPAVP